MNQWSALADFVRTANNNKISVFLEIVSYRVGKELNQIAPAQIPNGQGGCMNAPPLTNGQRAQIAALGTSYAAYVNQFVDQVAAYPNVLIWGFNYGIDGSFTDFWHNAYPAVLSHLNQEFPAGRPLLALDLDVKMSESNDDVLGHLSPYQWDWSFAQQQAYGWNALGTQLNIPIPDIYAIQAWTASHTDYQTAIKCIGGTPDSFMCPAPAQTCGNGLCPVPASKMIVTEFGTGSSMESVASGLGNGIPTFGDAQTPTTTAAGQAQYLQNELCMFHNLGVAGYAYFGLYDAATFYEAPPNNLTGWELAWGGYWGLIAEDGTYKPSWATMTTFNPTSCPGAFPPVVALQTDSGSYPLDKLGTMWYTAADVTLLSTKEILNTHSYSCSPNKNYADLGKQLVGSCAFMQFQPTSTSVTLMGYNGSESNSADAPFVMGVPLVTHIHDFTTNQDCTVINFACSMNIGQTDTLEVFGQGFNPMGGNSIQFVNQVNSNEVTWFLTGLVHNPPYPVYFWESSPGTRNTTQINVGLDCTVTPVGGWNLVVRGSGDGTPSSAVSINIVQGGTCQ